MFEQMKKIASVHTFAIVCIAMLVFACPVLAFAQETITVPTQDEWAALIAALGGLKGASAMIIAGFVVQMVMLALRTPLGEVAGKYRLVVVYALTLISGILALKASGLEIGSALVHSNTLAAFQVFLNQIYKQFIEKKD